MLLNHNEMLFKLDHSIPVCKTVGHLERICKICLYKEVCYYSTGYPRSKMQIYVFL